MSRLFRSLSYSESVVPFPAWLGFCHAGPSMARRSVQQLGDRSGSSGAPEERQSEPDLTSDPGRTVSVI